MRVNTLSGFGALAASLLFMGGWTVVSVPDQVQPAPGECLTGFDEPDPPVYYAIDLVTTKRVPRTRRATGVGNLTYAASPFGVAISRSGTYVYVLDIAIEGMSPARSGVYVAWVTTPSLDQIRRVGVLDEHMHIRTRVDWNQFLVVITLEPSADELGDTWSGPIVMRGVSRSGLMHTMAGHGPFQAEPCAVFGYR